MNEIGKKAIMKEKKMLRQNTDSRMFDVVIWPKDSEKIKESYIPKLVILKEDDQNMAESIYETRGDFSRIYRDNIFILAPSEEKRKKLHSVSNHRHESLQGREAKSGGTVFSNSNENMVQQLKKCYSILYLPKGNKVLRIKVRRWPANDTVDGALYDYITTRHHMKKQLDPAMIESRYVMAMCS